MAANRQAVQIVKVYIDWERYLKSGWSQIVKAFFDKYFRRITPRLAGVEEKYSLLKSVSRAVAAVGRNSFRLCEYVSFSQFKPTLTMLAVKQTIESTGYWTQTEATAIRNFLSC